LLALGGRWWLRRAFRRTLDALAIDVATRSVEVRGRLLSPSDDAFEFASKLLPKVHNLKDLGPAFFATLLFRWLIPTVKPDPPASSPSQLELSPKNSRKTKGPTPAGNSREEQGLAL